MHAAPSVTYPVGRSAFAAQVLAGAALAGLAAACAWAWQSDAFGWRQGLAFAALTACSALAAATWRRTPAGVLCWDGLAWTSEEGGAVGSGRPEVALDLQSRLLLRWSADGAPTRWYWVERLSAPAHWEALRRAVYSRASTPLPPAGEPPAAEQ